MSDIGHDPDDFEGGLARERTVLAWQRTGLAYVGAGAVLMKTLPVTAIPGSRTVLAVGFVATGLIAVALGFAQDRLRGRLAFHVISLITTAVAAAAVTVSLLPHP